jgi:hypothetical protein
VEPDVRGATTIRELLATHRSDPACAACHANIDFAGFALESFDVIGGERLRYRSLENGDPAPRGSIDPFIGIRFLLGPVVDPSGAHPDGSTFNDIRELRAQLASDRHGLAMNLVRQWLVYATGREVAFSDRDELEKIVSAAEMRGGGVRTLLHEVVRSSLFRLR